MNTSSFIHFLLKHFKIEYTKHERSGIYGFIQVLMAYNSNKIEGSTLTEEQTASLFDTGVLPKSEDYYRAKDVEEMNGHFLMFNKMLDTLDLELTEELIKAFHYELKSGIFEDRANGYAIGDYKKRPNMIGIYETVLPSQVSDEMSQLLAWYNNQDISLEILAEFYARYESIHPFQDGNGRTGRMILFRECLYHGIAPFIIEDANRPEYLDCAEIIPSGKRRDSIDFIISKRTGILLESLSVLSGRINVYAKEGRPETSLLYFKCPIHLFSSILLLRIGSFLMPLYVWQMSETVSLQKFFYKIAIFFHLNQSNRSEIWTNVHMAE